MTLLILMNMLAAPKFHYKDEVKIMSDCTPHVVFYGVKGRKGDIQSFSRDSSYNYRVYFSTLDVTLDIPESCLSK